MTTKNILVFFVLAVFTFSTIQAQNNNDEIQTLFQKNDPEGHFANGFYTSLSFGWTMVDNENAFFIGPRVAWIANHYLAIGIAGGGFSNFMKFPRNGYYSQDEYFMAGGYAGLLIEPIIMAKQPVHVSFPIIIGGGGAAVNSKNSWTDFSYNGDYYNNDIYFVFEPGAELELNIAKFFRIAVGASYRLTNKLDMTYSYFNEQQGQMVSYTINEHALNAFNVKLSLKFGIF